MNNSRPKILDLIIALCFLIALSGIVHGQERILSLSMPVAQHYYQTNLTRIPINLQFWLRPL